MVKGKMLFAVLLLITWSFEVRADPLMRYTYLDLGYRWLEIDQSGYGGASSNDFTSSLSISPIAHLALEGGYGYGTLGYGAHRNTFSYGALGYLSVADSLDLFAHAGGLHTYLSTEYFDQEGEGIYSGIGLRGLISKNYEAAGEVQFTDSLQQQWSGIATLTVAVHENVALRGQAKVNDNADTELTIGVRFTP